MKERLMNNDNKNCHFVYSVTNVSTKCRHGEQQTGHAKMTGPGFVNLFIYNAKMKQLTGFITW